MSRRSRWEYFRTVYARYRQADRRLKQAMLNEFCAYAGYNRKYATGAIALVYSVIFFIAQVWLSRWWLTRFRFGPVKWLWRWLTYGRPQPWRANLPRR
jgi:hypothetical protein